MGERLKHRPSPDLEASTLLRDRHLRLGGFLVSWEHRGASLFLWEVGGGATRPSGRVRSVLGETSLGRGNDAQGQGKRWLPEQSHRLQLAGCPPHPPLGHCGKSPRFGAGQK